ncbi:hypothetical protein PQR12_32785, partial [Paraburkholderia nemoris]
MKSWIECNARRLAVALAVGGCVLALSGCGSSDNVASPAPVDYAALCTKINGQQFNGITVTATSRIAAAGGNPGYCKVSATGAASTTLDIEVDLPDNWSKRLLQQGGGGFLGGEPTHAKPPP